MNLFDQMLERYTVKTPADYDNAVREIMQEVALAGLYRGGFFEKAAFYGGTCLRIFHGIQRFSEDMDFSLLKPNKDFTLEPYFSSIRNEFLLVGKEVQISRKTKSTASTIESAFLKEGTLQFDLDFQFKKMIKIKLEVDINPPGNFDTEYKLLMQPFSFMARCYALPDLFAGKMHALMFRQWKTRVKGRDWYDFQWYVSRGIPLNLEHFAERCRQTGNLTTDSLSPQAFLEMLKTKIANTDIQIVKKDILPFIKNQEETNIWSKDYFIQVAGLLKYA